MLKIDDMKSFLGNGSNIVLAGKESLYLAEDDVLPPVLPQGADVLIVYALGERIGLVTTGKVDDLRDVADIFQAMIVKRSELPDLKVWQFAGNIDGVDVLTVYEYRKGAEVGVAEVGTIDVQSVRSRRLIVGNDDQPYVRGFVASETKDRVLVDRKIERVGPRFPG